MSTPERDDELERFLAQRAVLPRALQEQEQSEPPAELDRIVLQKAQAALEPGAARRVMRRNRWFVPLTLAATIVLSFTVVLRIQQSGDSPYTPMSGRVIEPAATTESQDTPPQQAEAPRLRRIPERVMRREIAVPQLETQEAMTADTATGGVPLSEEIAGLAKEASAAAPSAPASESRRSAAAAEIDGVAATPAPPAAAKAAVVGQVEADPSAWLKRIEQLRAAGKNAEADREWQAFRKRYPDYELETEAK